MTDASRYEAWQAAARAPAATCPLDLAVAASRGLGNPALLVRALGVEPVYLRAQGGAVATSHVVHDDGSTTRYAHVFSTPLRLTSGWPEATTEGTITEVLLPRLVPGLPEGAGVRLDPDLPGEVVLDPDDLVEVVATAMGHPTRSALTPVEGEALRMEPGPDGHTALDARVLAALGARWPGARVRRAALTLEGLGGRTWPVLDVQVGDPLAAGVVEAAAGVPVVVVVDGEPAPLVEHLMNVGGATNDTWRLLGGAPGRGVAT